MESTLELRLAVVAAIGTVVMVMYLFALLVSARIYARIRRLRRDNFVDSWREYLASDSPPYPARILALYPDEVLYLIRCWTLEYNGLRDAFPSGIGVQVPSGGPSLDSRPTQEVSARLQRLRDIAHATGLTHAALALAFRSRDRRDQIAGIQCLGGLGRTEVADRLAELLDGPDYQVSLAAFEALIRVAPEETRVRLGEELCRHPEWPEHALARLVRELDETSRAALLEQVWKKGDADCRARVISALESIHYAGASRLVETELDRASAFDDIIRLLYAVRDESHVARVEHEVARIRDRHRAGTRPAATAPGWHHDYARLLDGWLRLDERRP